MNGMERQIGQERLIPVVRDELCSLPGEPQGQGFRIRTWLNVRVRPGREIPQPTGAESVYAPLESKTFGPGVFIAKMPFSGEEGAIA